MRAIHLGHNSVETLRIPIQRPIAVGMTVGTTRLEIGLFIFKFRFIRLRSIILLFTSDQELDRTAQQAVQPEQIQSLEYGQQ